MPINPYTQLFEEMIAWYARRKIDASYRRAYAVITMSVLAFLNVNSLLLIGIRSNVDVAKAIFAVERHFPASAILAAGLLVAHTAIFKTRKTSGAEVRRDFDVVDRSGTLAAAYLIISFVLIVYASRWAPVIH
jgi:hypothetical protein